MTFDKWPAVGEGYRARRRPRFHRRALSLALAQWRQPSSHQAGNIMPALKIIFSLYYRDTRRPCRISQNRDCLLPARLDARGSGTYFIYYAT